MSNISLIVGLGNPGKEYAQTRHNAGFWFVEQLADRYGISLKADPKFHGYSGRGQIEGHDVRLLLPTTFMNRSGQSVVPFAKFYQVAPEAILIAHDELDMNPGIIRLKTGGGHGGHNGLRDIVPHIGANFHRLRIGIGHPGAKERVSGHVLGKAPSSEQGLMDAAIDHALSQVKMLVGGQVSQAMNQINAYKPA
ncbi:peptidyl-tRNA hydrolase [Acinetobacter gyllenbergii]|uniref:Peptidyl-tRNA hydrolase n=1 Tax=Acinetobacter gyllenbergii CIP 110306 = MTCC 11365 TaxID=1217657 RepID=A0A829HEA9_9GAMM|nr:aminoacyl-tRNA hydrolase [Acinetobacter gyllenbergii]EPF77400.1 peptidyl-tRNA hydrolase [Acinetobacter gyllenbergii CIP 110306 = MTCC 11365]EPH33431.1 Peptidyl-tRNA hydrolase [Acinetobacter gyllenbergii CIP 110306 = MTCC 11365]ESK41442.1 peptidyl-tRNA hydrolase [Acinetobacter gyllenbergii NIPH 230]MCU4581065.1 aminoacyl-tRNA hydrolase [Acinetobacter gyllenbergii]OBY73590.1 peptidyl-tRNA hydrolase [Acinetobacter gyllenbergii]